FARQSGEQTLGARERTGERIAQSYCHGGRRRLAFLDHMEMRIERRDLVDLGQSELHLGRQSGEMGRRQMTVVILNKMQMLDQEIAPALAVTKQRAYLLERLRVDLTALRRARRATPAASAAVAAIGRRRARQVGEAHNSLLKWKNPIGNGANKL